MATHAYKWREWPNAFHRTSSCRHCGQTKPRSEFYQTPRGDWRAACNSCHGGHQGVLYDAKKDDPIFKEKNRAKARAWEQRNPNAQRERRAKDPEKYAAIVRLSRLGVTREQYDAVWDAQGGLCCICDMPLVKIGGTRAENAAHTDHDHDTNEFRGILSKLCNMALGMFMDSPHRLLRAMRYLSEHGKKIEPDVEGIPVVLPF